MASKTQMHIPPAFDKLQKLMAKLLKMRRNGTLHSMPFYKQRALVKRYDRYLNKMIKTDHSISKAVGLFTVAMLFSLDSQAQASCRQFVKAESINPLPLQTLPFAIEKPVFVDIDNDGDFDCYAIDPDELYNVKVAFLRNTGTKKSPSFQLDATGGFPGETTIGNSPFIQGMVFTDLDGDGDYDCFISNYNNAPYVKIEYFENVGDKSNPSFVQRMGTANPLSTISGYYGLYFNLVDIDADGDYDLYTYDLYYNDFYKNTGTKTNPQFVNIQHEERIVNRKNAHTIFTDWNKDGPLDYIKTNVIWPRFKDNEFYKNEGTIYKPRFVIDSATGPVFPQGFNLYSLVDLNNDGFPGAFSYTGNFASMSPVPTITAIQTGQAVVLQAYPKGNYTYQWRRNRVKLVNETKDSIIVSQSGNYMVEITGNCGMGVSLPYKVKINIQAVASLSPGKGFSAATNTTVQLQLYPNPFTTECVLQLNKAIAGNILVHITDAQGKTVTSLKADNNVVQFGKELAPGIYFIQVIQNNKIVFSQKLIKQ